MKTAGKVWGRTSEIKTTPNFELHRIVAKKGHHCSEHKHEHKINAFYVETGLLKITVWQPSGTTDVTHLGPNEYMEVRPRVFHMFEALEDTIAFEIYWVELDGNDIERRTHGE